MAGEFGSARDKRSASQAGQYISRLHHSSLTTRATWVRALYLEPTSGVHL